MTRTYESWGRWPRAKPAGVVAPAWIADAAHHATQWRNVLPYGNGRSYGDVCLNAGGTLIDTRWLDHFMEFNETDGVLRCEAGVKLGDILRFVVPRGWFLAVVPGTQHVTVGGAIANDVHGKNHHVAGTFGRHVRALRLVRSDGTVADCSPNSQPALYAATIGGLGLTGLIVSAELQLQRVSGPGMAVERQPFTSLREFLSLCDASDAGYAYTAAWFDASVRGAALGRGIFLRANHSDGTVSPRCETQRCALSMPWEAPRGVLHHKVVRTFNRFYYHAQRRSRQRLQHYAPYLFPLDGLRNWNRLYGPLGLAQFQCVVPVDQADAVIREMLAYAARADHTPCLAVLKRFGDLASPGLLSFPRPGVTLALDFARRGDDTLRLLERLNTVAVAARGAIYPAKDATMSRYCFEASFPRWNEFTPHIDPAFSSNLWRRVRGVS